MPKYLPYKLQKGIPKPRFLKKYCEASILSAFKFLIISLFIPTFAFANYGDSFGIGTRNNFLGGSADVTDGGAFASVGNPAVLVNAYNAPFDLSIRTNQPSLESPDLKFKNQPLTGLPNDTYKSEKAGNMSTFSGGGNLPLGKRLVLGGSVLLPLDSLARVYAFSGNESNYLHYMDRQSRPEIYTGAGIRVLDWFSLGAGFFGSIQELGREPTPEEIADKMELPVDKVKKVQKISKEPISLETPIGEEEDSNLGDFIEDKKIISPSDAIMSITLSEQTRAVLSTLTPREEKVLRMRFGIGEKSDHTLEEVGQDFFVTRERIRQIEAKALRKLRHPSRSKLLKAYTDNS